MLRTRLTDILGIDYPVIQGGMAWVADATLAAAVSEAGGLGLIAAGAAPAEAIREEIRKARSLTDRQFGVNVMLLSPYADEIISMVIEEGVGVVTTGAGSPGKYMEALKSRGIKVLPVAPSVALGLRLERMGADAVIAEGCEAGGHIGESTTMTLVPQMVDALHIPVVAAGGIADGRGMAAALCLGAEGVQCGTCFLVAEECGIHHVYKQKVLNAGDADTIVTGRSVGRPVRSIKTPFTRQYLEMEKSGASQDELETLAAGSLRKAVKEGDLESGTFMAGQIAGLLKKEARAGEIIVGMVTEAESLLSAALSRWAGKEVQDVVS